MQKIAHFQNAVTTRVELFNETIRPREMTSFREIYRDLVALDDEFHKVDCDLRNQTIAVTTEPIVLEDLYLGPFQIRLNWSDLDSNPGYTVIALEPNCASVNGDTVHPHVENDQLCEGDGREKIARPVPIVVSFAKVATTSFVRNALMKNIDENAGKPVKKNKKKFHKRSQIKKKCDAVAALQSIRLGEACLLPRPGIDRSGSLRNQPAAERSSSHC